MKFPPVKHSFPGPRLFCVLLACWLTGTTECEAQLPEQWPARSSILAKPSSPGELEWEATPADERIVDALRQRLSTSPGVHSYEIQIGARYGVVTLSGLVADLLAKERAAELAKTVPGVREVYNQIEVSASERSDSILQLDVRRVLRDAPAIKEYEISTTVRNGFVTLSGGVESWQQRRLAGLLAKGVYGVRGVENKLRVAPVRKRKDRDIKEDIVSRLQWDVWLRNPSVNVTVNHGRVQLSGFVSSASAKERATNDAWVMGVNSVDASMLQVAPNVPEAMEHAGKK